MMVVETQSGSTYTFTTKGNQIYMLKGLNEYLVKEFSLALDRPLQVCCCKLNTYDYKPGTELFIRTTPVVHISI